MRCTGVGGADVCWWTGAWTLRVSASTSDGAPRRPRGAVGGDPPTGRYTTAGTGVGGAVAGAVPALFTLFASERIAERQRRSADGVVPPCVFAAAAVGEVATTGPADAAGKDAPDIADPDGNGSTLVSGTGDWVRAAMGRVAAGTGCGAPAAGTVEGSRACGSKLTPPLGSVAAAAGNVSNRSPSSAPDCCKTHGYLRASANGNRSLGDCVSKPLTSSFTPCGTTGGKCSSSVRIFEMSRAWFVL
mmetsp:Transcript_66797/g.186382  ORF Transcript_66797/g.186382 Transcript_66797/m.186382 type:complete len:245 (+) Transcript_66797:979-1713(+)